MKILVVHEVNYLTKIIYEFQILPEILSILGHKVTIIDYDDSWRSERTEGFMHLKTRVHPGVHRAYSNASVLVRRPGMIRIPVISRISGAIAGGIEVARTLHHDKPDVVLLYGLPTIGLQTLLAARSFGVPVVFRSIDVTHQLVPRLLRGVTKTLEKLIFKAVAFNIALTPHLRSYIQSYGVSESHIRLLPSGVDAEMFSPGPRDIPWLAEWGIGPDDPVILFMGTLYEFSGLDRVISEFPRLLQEHPKARLLIAGVGIDEQRLRNLAEKNELSKHVIFTGMLPYSKLPNVVRSSDVCINPFELNGITENILPTKLFQYMTCGKPVLATPLPGTETFLAGETDGLVYSSLDDFTERLSQLLSDRERCKRVGEQGRVAGEKYGWFNIARTMALWLEEAS